MTAHQTTSASYEVGYRKPPRHTQFQKGQSGNPGGRPRRSPAERLEELALYEAYRTTIVMEDGHAVPMPAIQAVLRRHLESAASGNVRAQRDILAMIRDIERVRSIEALFDEGGANDVADDTDDADVIDGDDDDADGRADRDVNDADDNDADEITDTADADRDGAGADDDSARQQTDGIDTHGDGPQAEPETTLIGVRSRLDGAANSSPPPCGEGSGVGVGRDGTSVPHRTTPHPNPPPQGGRESRRPNLMPKRRGVLSRRDGAERSAGAKPARPQPGRRRRSPAVNAGKIRERHSRSSPRSPGRTSTGPGLAQAAGRHAPAPAAPAERDEKLKTPC